MAAEKGTDESADEHVGLHNLNPAPGSRRPRKRVGRGEGSGTGKTSGRGQKGYGSRAGAKDRARFEGGQNPIHMRMRKLRGPNKKMSMPFEPFRTHTQPVNLDDLEARFDDGAEVDARRDEGRRPRHPPRHPGQGARARRADQEAHGARARLLEVRPRADRGGRRHLPDHRLAAHRVGDAVLATILNSFRVAEIRKKLAVHGGDARALPARVLHPGPGRQHRRRSTQLAVQLRRRRTSSACSTCSPAEGCRGSRSSRWGSCRTSRPRSSCSC